MRRLSYIWNDSAGGVSVHMSLSVISKLGLEAMKAFKAVPRRGLEIGGLLLGRSQTVNGIRRTHVTEYVPIDFEHRSGPSYRPSPADLEVVQNSLRGHPDTVGIYRTHTRSEKLTLDSDDLELFRTSFPAGDGLFLLIRPMPGEGVIWLPKEGTLTAVHSFPFYAAELAADVPAEIPEKAAAPKNDVQESSQPSPAVPDTWLPKVELTRAEPAVLTSASPAHRRWLTAAAALMAGALGGAAVEHYRPRPVVVTAHPPAPAEPRPMQLWVEQQGKAMSFRWDRNSAAILGAARAVLQIQDGNHQSELDLDQTTLRSGLLSYWPETADVTFRLTLFHGDRQIVQAVRAINGQFVRLEPVVTATAPPEPTASTNSADRLAEVKKPSPFELPPAPEEAKKIAAPVKITPAAAEEKPAPAPAAPKGNANAVVGKPQVQSPQQPVGAPSPIAAEERHMAKAEAPPSASAPPAPAPVVTRPAPKVAEARVSVTAEPVSGSRFGRAVGKIPLLRRLKKSPQAFVPPAPLRQSKPTLTARDQRSLNRPVDVDVKVYISETGKVDYAELLSDVGRHPDLSNAAVYAARRWDFVPARMGTEKVPGEVILHFRFEPSADINR